MCCCEWVKLGAPGMSGLCNLPYLPNASTLRMQNKCLIFVN